MDVLSGIVEAANAHVSLEPVKEYRGSFSEFCAGANHNIHFVISGRCALILEDAERTSFELGAGDLVILSDRQNHRLHGDAADGARLRIVSGRLVSQRTGSEAIFECLPPVFTINLNGPTAAEQLDRAVRVGGALEEEAGGRALLSRVAELLILMEAKRRLKSVPDTVSGWAGAFSDPKIGRALAAIHADPSRNWTSALLAKEAAMSRTAFSERFRERIGEPPMTYVLRWRIQVAIDLLRAGTLPLAEVAQAAGYANESAFGKAFRREIGVSPAAYRRAAMEASRDSETLGAEQLRERAAESSAPKGDLGVELTQIVLEFERLAPPALCSVLLLNEHEQKLYVGAAPSLPEAYNRTIDGMGVGPQAGCCGAAVYLKRPVVTRDIPHSELWADYRYLAERFNLRSCWSSPILGDNGAVLGTFAVYYSDFHEPSGAELGLMDHMSRRVKSLLQACVRRSLGRADSERSDDTTERMEHRAG